MKLFYSLFVILFSASASFAANDQELYDPKPPADAAFVRFVNGTTADVVLSGSSIAAQDIIAHGNSDFFVVKQGEQNFTIGDTTETVTIESGKYYTIAATDNGIATIDDAILDNPAKSILYFYNLSSKEAVTLFAPKHKTAIFDAVAKGTGTSRDVNPLTLNLVVNEGDAELVALAPIALKRRTGHSVFVMNDGEAVKAVIIENAISK